MKDPLTGYLRVKAICVLTHEGRMLAIEDHDPTKGTSFWVPVGGRVEFGETSREAIRREVREELSTDVDHLLLLGVLENLFTFDGSDGHEVVFVYDGRLGDASMYTMASVRVTESNGRELVARWIDPSEPDNGWPLYPDGLADLVTSTSA